MNDGDLVIINTDNFKPKDGVAFAINYEGELVIKRMKRDAGQWFISSDNPDKVRYGDKLCADGCFVLGEVVYLQTETI
ncbi:MAG: S24 family peptidase [Deltaproteobacteria bacterium]|nr:S24 family peptidase [Deltaproteobacteria bacterium]